MKDEPESGPRSRSGIASSGPAPLPDPSDSSRRPFFRRPIPLAVAATLLAVAVSLVFLIVFRPHTLSGMLRRMSRSAAPTGRSLAPGGLSETGALSPGSEEEPLPFFLTAAHADRPLGLAPGGTAFHLLAITEDFQDGAAGTSTHWIWRINLGDGRIALLNSGDVVAVESRAGRLLFLQNAGAGGRRSRFSRWLPPVAQLLYSDSGGTLHPLAEGDVDSRWIGFSPDGQGAFYRRRDDSGVATFLVDLDSRKTRAWPPRNPDLPVSGETPASNPPLPAGSEAVVTDWLKGGDTLLRMTLVPLESTGEKGGSAPARFEVVSVDTGEIVGSVVGPDDRRWIHGPDYPGGDYFAIATADAINRRSRRVDFYGLSPLRPIAATRGDDVSWPPDLRAALVERGGRGRGQWFSSEVGVFRSDTGAIEEFDLQSLDPPMERFLPGSFSPDSKTFLAVSYRDSQTAIVDLESRAVVRAIPDLVPTDYLWSPGGDWIALVGFHGDPTTLRSLLLDVSTGDVTELPIRAMRPAEWLDADTVLLIGRWVGQESDGGGPLSMAFVDAPGGTVREMPLR